MSDFFKRNRLLVGMILGALYGFIYPNMDPELNPFCFYAKFYSNMSTWCFYISDVIGGGIVGGMVAAKTENDEQAVHRMAFGAFIGGVIGSLMLFQIAAPINKLAAFLFDGALIGLAYRWAFKGALIGMMFIILIGISILLIEGLFAVNLEEVMGSLVIGALWGATGGASLWLLFGETSSSSRRRSRKEGWFTSP